LRIEELLTQNYVESQMSRAVQLSHDELLQTVACVVRTKEDKYCRAVVKSNTVDDQGLFQVYLVDYGKLEMVADTCIHPLHIACADIPQQAVHCCLSGVYPLSGSTWDDDAVSRFYELVDEKQLTGRVVMVPEYKETKLLVSLTCSSELVTETLINAGFCSKIPVSDTPIVKFCKELCGEIKAKFLSGTEKKSTFLADKMNEFVKRLSSVLHEQLDQMEVDIMSECTAQDIVYYISQQILCELLDDSYTPETVPTVCHQDSMRVEMQNIIGELLEEVMRVTSEIVDSMCDDALLAIDNIVLVEQPSSGEAQSAAEVTKETAEQTATDMREQEPKSITEITEKADQLEIGVAKVEAITETSSDDTADLAEDVNKGDSVNTTATDGDDNGSSAADEANHVADIEGKSTIIEPENEALVESGAPSDNEASAEGLEPAKSEAPAECEAPAKSEEPAEDSTPSEDGIPAEDSAPTDEESPEIEDSLVQSAASDTEEEVKTVGSNSEQQAHSEKDGIVEGKDNTPKETKVEDCEQVNGSREEDAAE